MEDIVLFNRVCISNFRDEREAVLTRTKSVERARHWDAADQRIPQEELAQLVLVFRLEAARSSVTLMKRQLDRQMLKHVGRHQQEVRKVNHRICHMVGGRRDKGQLLNKGQPLGLALDGIGQTLELIFRAEEETPVAVAIRDIRHSHTDARKCAQIAAAALQVSGDEGQDLVWEVEKPKGASHCFFSSTRQHTFKGERQEHPGSPAPGRPVPKIRYGMVASQCQAPRLLFLSGSVEAKGTGSRRRFIHKFWDASFFLLFEKNSLISLADMLAELRPYVAERSHFAELPVFGGEGGKEGEGGVTSDKKKKIQRRVAV